MTSAGGVEYHRTISDITMVTCHVSRHDLPVQEVGHRVADGEGEDQVIEREVVALHHPYIHFRYQYQLLSRLL